MICPGFADMAWEHLWWESEVAKVAEMRKYDMCETCSSGKDFYRNRNDDSFFTKEPWNLWLLCGIDGSGWSHFTSEQILASIFCMLLMILSAGCDWSLAGNVIEHETVHRLFNLIQIKCILGYLKPATFGNPTIR